MPSAYQTLETRFRRMHAIGGAVGILSWDRSTMMPPGGAEARAEQVATLAVLNHELLTAPDMGGLIDSAQAEPGLGSWQHANIGEMRRQWLHATAVPADLVEALSKASSNCEMIWREAKRDSDFARVRPALETVLALTRQQADALAAALGTSPYDALLDSYDPGLTQARIDEIFAPLEAALPDLIAAVLEAQARRPKAVMPKGPFSAATQQALGRRLMTAAGFDFNHGRLDVSAHPFCGGGPGDIRITTRYDEADFTSALMGVLHETGHALYELGLPQDWRGQPVGNARGMTMHESQSLLIEMQAARSRPFLEYLAPLLREVFAPAAAADDPLWGVENLLAVYTHVERGFIRVEADEVTYPAHVLLRYRLETALLAGDLKVAELPLAWNEGMQRLLAITPPDDRLGCLQDIHWFDGAFGYFPTYTLGAMAAAQLFAAATAAEPGILPAIGRGDFRPLLAWLRPHVHAKGSFLGTDALLTAATGRPLDPAIHMAHLKRRYLG